jgi:hyperosmotically inducible protein
MMGCIPKLLSSFLFCACLGGCAAAVVGGAAAGGYYATRSDRSTGVIADDASITSAINKLYVQDDLVSALDVSVGTNHGTVTLRGSLPSQEAVRRAVDIARSVKGVTRVVSHLTVVPN